MPVAGTVLRLLLAMVQQCYIAATVCEVAVHIGHCGRAVGKSDLNYTVGGTWQGFHSKVFACLHVSRA